MDYLGNNRTNRLSGGDVMKEQTALSAYAMVCITTLTTVALWLGYDSAILATSLAAIGGMAGYKIGIVKGAKKKKRK